MPYIPEIDRNSLRPNYFRTPENPGELNFQICSLVKRYLIQHGTTYARLNDAIGALECAKQEIYHRLARPYEDTKCLSNGDVFGGLI